MRTPVCAVCINEGELGVELEGIRLSPATLRVKSCHRGHQTGSLPFTHGWCKSKRTAAVMWMPFGAELRERVPP